MPAEITAEHLNKMAYVYVRQSSLHQVQHHIQSQKLQYDLVALAQAKGWRREQIVIVDEDLGKSASGTTRRQGFENMLTHICLGEVGALLCAEASRLSRNGREWNQVVDFCGIVGTLLIDYDGIYDPRLPSDRLLLGMKGTVSQFEVALFRKRAQEAIRKKAESGELWRGVGAAFNITEDNRCEINPDQRIQQVTRLVLTKLPELGSVSQVHKWFRREGLEVPVRDRQQPHRILWRLPGYDTIRRILTNPLYAGTYVYPRTQTITRIVEGQPIKTGGHVVPLEKCQVLLRDLFPGYISWDDYERNQRIIAQNAAMKGQMVRGPARDGKALLIGLLRCQRCSRKLRVRYHSAKRDQATPFYFCEGERTTGERKYCVSFSGRLLEQAVVKELLAVLQPHAIEAALLAEEKLQQAMQQKRDALSQALEQARYEADRLHRQLDAVDPENGLVFRELSARWEKALQQVAALKRRYERLLAQQQPLVQDERDQLLRLAENLARVWEHPATAVETKKRLLRTLLQEIWVQACDTAKLKATLHWQGGVHTELLLKRPRRGERLDNTKRQTVALIKQLVLVADDGYIARILNRIKHKTGKGQTWTQSAVAEFRAANNIKAFSQKEYDQRGWLNLTETAKELGINAMSVLQLIKRKIIHAEQAVAHAPWIISRSELDKPTVRQIAESMKQNHNVPIYRNPNQLTLE